MKIVKKVMQNDKICIKIITSLINEDNGFFHLKNSKIFQLLTALENYKENDEEY